MARSIPTRQMTAFLPALLWRCRKTNSSRIWVGTGVGVSVFHNGKFEHIDISAMENAEYAFGFTANPAICG
jgi:hypothetical protein